MPFDPTVAIVFGSILLSLILSLGYALVHQALKYKTAQQKNTQGLSRSMTAGELEALVREAAIEAARPLEKRMAALEADIRQLYAALGEEAGKALSEQRSPLPGLMLDDPEAEADYPPVRRRVR